MGAQASGPRLFRIVATVDSSPCTPVLPMIIVVRPDATDAQIQHIVDRVQELGFQPHYSRGQHRTIIGVIGDESKAQTETLAAIAGVEQVLAIMKPFKLASRELHAEDTVVQVGAVK